MNESQTTPELDEQGRPEPPSRAGETATLLGFLDFLRATFAWKCAGLDAAGMRATIGPSSMTLGGMMKHLTWVEDFWFSRRLHGNDAAAPWDQVDWEADSDWDWNSAEQDTPEQLRLLWQDAVDRSRGLVAAALETGGLESPGHRLGGETAEQPHLRWMLVHMIEEYARHVGHADLLRESIDGLTGD